MTTEKEFVDDLADGGGNAPLKAQVIAVRDHLKRHNREFSIRKTHEELVARNFKVGVATVGRWLRPIGGGNPPNVKSETAEAAKRAGLNRKNVKASAPPETKATVQDAVPADTKRADEVTIPTIAALIEQMNSSTTLAINENRARMAINTIIMHTMAAFPERLLLDMRGTAALVDALTVAAKLSGGAAIDITVPSQEDRDAAARGISPEGHDMKDITPQQSALVTKIDAWRRQGTNGKGT